MIKKLLTLFILLSCKFSFATHNKGGRIEVEQISQFEFRIIIYTYTKTSSIQADRPTLDSVYCNGSPVTFVRLTKIDLQNDVSINTYVNNCTYPSNGIFKIHFSDPNWDADVVNIPHSVNVPFYLETEFKIDPFGCLYYSPHLLTIPIFETPFGKDFILSRAAYDPNWDSLSFTLENCLDANGTPIGGYFIPPGASINSLSGELKWEKDSMTSMGTYAFAIKTTKWRHGVYSGFVLENFQVTTGIVPNATYDFNTSSYPVDFTSHILPGSPFNLHVEYSDTFASPAVEFYSEISNLVFNHAISNHTFSGDLTWTPTTQNIRNTPYLLQFRGRKDLTYLLYVDGVPNDTCRPLVGIDEMDYNNNIRIFPNPATSQLQIDINDITNPNINFSLIDMLGRKIFEKNIMTQEIISVASFSRGMYFLNLEIGDRRYFRKIILD